MFKQLSNRVSAKTIEETFTDNDVLHVKDANGNDTSDISAGYNPTTGFTFDYPMRWLNDHSDFKAIGIRRLNVIPTAHVFALLVSFTYKLPNENPKEGEFYLPYAITSANTLEDILQHFMQTTNRELQEGGFLEFYLTYNFDYKTGLLTFDYKCVRKESFDPEYFGFSIEGYGDNDERKIEQLDFFLKFLNQERTQENRDMLTTYSEKKSFKHVWDRSHLQFHASFSDNRRGFIGLNNDFYENPSIFYDPPTNSSDFWIRFTTDGVHQILPRYCGFYIGICFVRNYKNSLVTK
jgi:hypothetical protein